MTGPNEHDDARNGARDSAARDSAARDNGREGDAAFDASDDLAAYVLDAVDPAERDAIERALAESPELRDEVDAYGHAAAQLAELSPPVAPPADLRARLMAAIDATPQQTADGPEQTADGPEQSDAAAPSATDAKAAPDIADTAASSSVADAPAGRSRAHAEARRRWFQRPGAVVAAAAAAVVLIVGAVVGIGWPGPNGWGAQLQMAAIADAPDAQTTTLEAAGGGEVTLVASASKGRSVVVADGLPDLGDDQTYELWYIDDSGAAPAGTFDTSGGETWRILDGTFTPGVVVGVTVEPAGGSPQPTTEPIVVIST